MPAPWVMDEDIWDKAKKAVDKKKYPGERYWRVVTDVYKNMGGRIKHKRKSSKYDEILTKYSKK